MCQGDKNRVGPVRPALPENYGWLPDVMGKPGMMIVVGYDDDVVATVRYWIPTGEPDPFSRDATIEDEPAQVRATLQVGPGMGLSEFAYLLTRYARLCGLTRSRRDLYEALKHLEQVAIALFPWACEIAREAGRDGVGEDRH